MNLPEHPVRQALARAALAAVCLLAGGTAGSAEPPRPCPNAGPSYDAIERLAAPATTGPVPPGSDAKMTALVQRLEACGQLRPLERRVAFMYFLGQGKIDQARAYVGKASGLVDIELPAADVGPRAAGRYWSVGDEAGQVKEHDALLSQGVHIVVISSTGCHFCRQAAAEIDQHPEVADLLQKHAVWISRPEMGFDLRSYRTWNRDHPKLPMNIVFDVAGWPMPKLWGTPEFLFVKDGVVVDRIEGWRTGSLEELRKVYRTLGLAS